MYRKFDQLRLSDLMGANILLFMKQFESIMEGAEIEFLEETLMKNIEDELRDLEFKYVPFPGCPSMLVMADS